MHIDQFIRLVEAEPERTVAKVFRYLSPEMQARFRSGGPIPLRDILMDPNSRSETRNVRYRHMLGNGIALEQLHSWQTRHPSHPLPEDLRQLLTRINGIRFWADADTGRATKGIASLEMWGPARVAMFGPDAKPEMLEDRYLSISLSGSETEYIALDTTSGIYIRMDAEDPEWRGLIASNTSDLLDWLWVSRGEP